MGQGGGTVPLIRSLRQKVIEKKNDSGINEIKGL